MYSKTTVWKYDKVQKTKWKDKCKRICHNDCLDDNWNNNVLYITCVLDLLEKIYWPVPKIYEYCIHIFTCIISRQYPWPGLWLGIKFAICMYVYVVRTYFQVSTPYISNLWSFTIWNVGIIILCDDLAIQTVYESGYFDGCIM